MPMIARPSGGTGASSWDQVSGKPSTFPPETPIAQSDVAGLSDDLAGRLKLHATKYDPICVVSGFTVSLSSGDWVVSAGSCAIGGRLYAYGGETIATGALGDGDYRLTAALVDGAIAIQVAIEAHQLPLDTEIPIAYSVVSSGNATLVYDRRNMLVGPTQMPWDPQGIKDLLILTAGTYADAWCNDALGSRFDPYFALSQAWCFVPYCPAQVKDLCDLVLAMHNNLADVSKVPAAFGTATWLALHGTTHSGAGDPGAFTPAYWGWRVDDPGGTPVIVRSDAHDSMAALLVRCMVRLARLGGSYATWWDSNWSLLAEIVYYNLLLPLHNTGPGYATAPFQDKDVYANLLTGDNIEVWRALADLVAWVTAHGNGTQTSWIAAQSVATKRDQVRDAIAGFWDNVPGEDGLENLAWYYPVGGPRPANGHDTLYPATFPYMMALLYRAPLYHGAVDAVTLWNERTRRFQECVRVLDALAPYHGRSARFGNVYSYAAMFAAAYASIGLWERARDCLDFFVRHHLRDGQLRFANGADVGWALYAWDALHGAPDAMGRWFEGGFVAAPSYAA